MTTTRWTKARAAALTAATLLAGAAQAQVSSSPPRQAPAGVNTAKPAPAPAQATTPQGSTQAASPQAGSEAQNVIKYLHARNVEAVDYGRLGQDHGTSPTVKELGRRIRSDAEKLDAELADVAKEHGVKLADANSIKQDPNYKRAMDALQKLSGAEFDRSFADGSVAAREGDVDQLKGFRDRTPGQDWKLKKYLDRYEDLMEEHRTLARSARDDARNRQARTPPHK